MIETTTMTEQQPYYQTESLKVLMTRGFNLKCTRDKNTHKLILENHTYNLLQLLRYEPSLKDMFWYNSFKHRVYVKQKEDDNIIDVELEDHHVAKLKVYCIDRWDVKFSKDTCWEAIELAARERARNPILDYIKENIAGVVDDDWITKHRTKKLCLKNQDNPKANCKPCCPGHTPLELWLHQYAGCNDTAINRIYAKRQLIGGIARLHATVRNPVKMEQMLVLYGEQGIYKSSLIAMLAFESVFGREYFGDSGFNVRNKQEAMQMIVGKFIYEIKELANRSNDETEKAFIDEQIDEGRLPYARKPSKYARTAILFGSTNKSFNILRDATGDRRFWVVSCNEAHTNTKQRMKLQEFKKAVHLLWAEAYYWYKKGAQWWIDNDSDEEQLRVEANKAYVSEHPLQDMIIEKAAEIYEQCSVVRVKDIIKMVYQEDSIQHQTKKWLDKNTRKNQAIIADCLQREGYRYTRKRPNKGEKPVRGWFK